MDRENSPRTVVVTGGTRGIGAAIVETFWKDGCHVVAGARSETDRVLRLGERVRFIKMDVRNEEDHRMLIRSALDWTGHVDVFVNCAGFSAWRPIGEADLEFWNRMIDTNLKGTFFGCKAASEHLKTGGSIINVSSLAGKRGSAQNAVYCASKFGVNGLTQALAKELGPRGIRVNAVCPVYVETEGLLEALGDKRAPSQGTPVRPFLDEFARGNAALLRLPRAEEVADVCLFLASPQASAVTGQCINVDCGVLPQ
jgi:NAD(P)-dependent dehydrogenase (short-subunit alcohol dehydrogenase family)